MNRRTNAGLLTAINFRLVLGVLMTALCCQAHATCKFFDGFKDNGDGTVTDPRNGLIWKRCVEGYFWNGKSCREGMEGRETITEMNWFEAMRVARQSHFQTKSGWRIPTKAEFEAVVGRHKDCKNNEFEGGKYAASRAIAHPATEKDGHPGIFWSSTPQAGKSVNAWNVNFDNGAVNATFRDAKLLVRLVRDSQPSDGKAGLEFDTEYKKIPDYQWEIQRGYNGVRKSP